MPTLLVATSPRCTWTTAPDQATADAMRRALTRGYEVVKKRAHTVDVGIGAEALEAGELLMNAGFGFSWHEDQHPDNPSGSAWGIPVTA